MKRKTINALKGKRKGSSEFIREYGIFGVLILTFVIAAVLEPNFLKPQNLTNIVKQIIPFGIVACAETLLIVSGSIDLAAGTTLALAACVGAKVLVATDSVVLVFLVAIGIGKMCIRDRLCVPYTLQETVWIRFRYWENHASLAPCKFLCIYPSG